VNGGGRRLRRCSDTLRSSTKLLEREELLHVFLERANSSFTRFAELSGEERFRTGPKLKKELSLSSGKSFRKEIRRDRGEKSNQDIRRKTNQIMLGAPGHACIR
jgi:hypothetical protein